MFVVNSNWRMQKLGSRDLNLTFVCANLCRLGHWCGVKGIIRLLLCIILYYMHYDSFQMQDGAILALCILTLVTAVILLVDFIIMARCLFTSMWSFRIKHLSFSRSVRNRRWKAPSVVQIFQCKVFQKTISESSLLPKYLISTEHNFRTN